jgi:hypothetical protein
MDVSQHVLMHGFVPCMSSTMLLYAEPSYVHIVLPSALRPFCHLTPCQQGSKGGRSGFRFPAAAPKVGGARITNSGKQAAFSLQAASAAAGRAGGARKGNPKKTNKQQRREEKAAKKAAK